MIKLRDYQQEIFDRVLSHGKEHSIIQLASGAGKSYIIAKLADFYKSQGLDVVVLVPWVVVRYQIADLLKEHSIDVPVSSANLVNHNKEKIKISISSLLMKLTTLQQTATKRYSRYSLTLNVLVSLLHLCVMTTKT